VAALREDPGLSDRQIIHAFFERVRGPERRPRRRESRNSLRSTERAQIHGCIPCSFSRGYGPLWSSARSRNGLVS
jgi:hypothetical protein